MSDPAPLTPLEIAWDYPELAAVLLWRLAPAGCVITREDLHALPMDRVLIEDREPHEMRFRWVAIAEALRLRKPLHERGAAASVSEMQGRWQKICVVVLWKFARDGLTLTRADRAAVPADKQLLMHGHADDLELRFMPHAEAARIAKWERDNEGLIITERTHL